MPKANFPLIQTLVFSYRNQFSLVIILGACCILQACNSGQNKQIISTDTTSSIITDSTIPPKSFLSKVCIESSLHILYAKTSDILNLYNHPHVSNIEKIIFQIYWQNGVFSLAAFEGGKNLGRSDYGNNNSPLILNVSSEFPGTGVYDMNNRNVLLSDQELNSRNDQNSNNDDITALHNYVNNKAADPFITFTPSIIALSSQINLIQYQVGHAAKEPLTVTLKKGKFIFTKYLPVPQVSPTNPTPPRNSY